MLLIDNYDSFTYNIAQLFQRDGARVRVERNDQITLEEAVRWRPTHVVVSPGPGRPEQSGISGSIIQHFSGRVPVLGVCLGHQLLVHLHGGRILRSAPVHGHADAVHHDGRGLFRAMPLPFQAARYHSLIAERASLPSTFNVSAWSGDLIMGVRHRPTGAIGVQFHPESVLTPDGAKLLQNFLENPRET